MLDKHIVFFERAVIEQQFYALAGRKLAFGMLRINPLLPAAQTGFVAALLKFFQNMFHFALP